jgi:nitrogen fixation protein FixH
MRTLLFLIALTAIGAVIGAFVVGSMVFDGTVVENPYEQGIAWDEVRKRREASGLTVTLAASAYRRGRNDIIVEVSTRPGDPAGEDDLLLRVSRPSSADYDKTYSAARQKDGRYGAVVDLPLRGFWVITVLVDRGGAPLEFNREVYVEE